MNGQKRTTVYWAVNEADYLQWAQRKLLLRSPVPLAFSKFGIGHGSSRANTMLKCPAHRASKQNIYTIPFPTSMDITFDDTGSILNAGAHKSLIEVYPSVTSRITFNIKFPILFFSEESVTIEILPPYLHDPVSAKHGHVAVGSFNIAKWFRPVNFEFVLWPDRKDFVCNEGDPMAYVKFHAKSPVILKEFKPDQKVFDTTIACSSICSVDSKRSLEYRYDQFKKSGMKKSLLSSIKAHVL